MPNERLEQNREKLYEEYEDSLFRLVMYDVAEKEGKLLLEENEQLKKDPALGPSQESISEFSKQLNTHLKKRKMHVLNRRISRIFNRAAVVVLTVIIVFTAAMLTVQAFRAEVLNFLINIQSKYTSFQLHESDRSSSSENRLVNWTNAYVPTYIPDGYEISSISNTESTKKLTFINKQNEDKFIIYSEYDSSTSIAVDTEGASLVETIKINGYDGTLAVKGSMVTVTWAMDNRLFFIQAQISKDEMIKIAEGVKFIK